MPFKVQVFVNGARCRNRINRRHCAVRRAAPGYNSTGDNHGMLENVRLVVLRRCTLIQTHGRRKQAVRRSKIQSYARRKCVGTALRCPVREDQLRTSGHRRSPSGGLPYVAPVGTDRDNDGGKRTRRHEGVRREWW